MGGGAMVSGKFSSASLEVLLRPLRPTRLAMSVLPSVVSDGSPGSCKLVIPLGVFSFVEDRSLFAGGFPPSAPLCFLWLKLPDSGAVDSPSADASRDDGWSWSRAAVLIEDGSVEVRFRFPALEPADDGDDIVLAEKLDQKE